MNTKTPNQTGINSDDTELFPTDIFGLLADDRRRYALHYLTQHVGGVALGELAEQIAIWEGDTTYEHYERILTGLHHTNLPKLTEAGLITYDRDTEEVTRQQSMDHVTPYLDLALPEDIL